MPMSEEARQKASARMKAMHAKKKANEAVELADEGLKESSATSAPPPQEATASSEASGEVSQAELIKQIKEIQETNALLKAALLNQGQGARVTDRGVVGTKEKFSINPADYPDPRERLTREPKLARFAFPVNYELTWDVTTTSYESIDGIRVSEPKFSLELNVIMRDEETDEPTAGRYTIRKASFHEDPQAAITVAQENGLAIDNQNEKAFLDEMRYLRIRDWLLEAFYPPKNSEKKQNKKQMVVGNRVVEYFEVSSVDSSKIPFGDLKGKV